MIWNIVSFHSGIPCLYSRIFYLTSQGIRPCLWERRRRGTTMLSASAVRRVFVAAALAAAAGAAMPASAAPVEPLVSAQWLKDHLRDPQIAVIDGRMGAPVYDAGHIPGSVHSDYDKAGWRVSRNGGLQPPNKAELEKLIGETGIDEDSHVIVVPAGVSASDFGAAARVYWTLKVAGHPA